MPVRIVSNEAAFKDVLYAHLADNLTDGAELYRDVVKEAISVQGPPRSSVGHAPHKDTGDLYESIDVNVDRDAMSAIVGSDMPYAAVLEQVTNRPYWVNTLLTNADAIGRAIANP